MMFYNNSLTQKFIWPRYDHFLTYTQTFQAKWSKIQKIKAPSFLELLRFKKAKCPYFFLFSSIWPRYCSYLIFGPVSAIWPGVIKNKVCEGAMKRCSSSTDSLRGFLSWCWRHDVFPVEQIGYQTQDTRQVGIRTQVTIGLA